MCADKEVEEATKGLESASREVEEQGCIQWNICEISSQVDHANVSPLFGGVDP